jgi:hypothetical protein
MKSIRAIVAPVVLLLAIAAATVAGRALALPSIASLLLIGDLALDGAGLPALRRDQRSAVLAFLALLGILLYAATLRVIPWDLYRHGFSPVAPLLLAAVAILIARSHPRIAIVALILLAAFDAHLLRSRNLFDYIVDPLLVAFGTAWLTWRAVRRLMPH